MRSMIGATLFTLCLTGGTAAGSGCSNCSTNGQEAVLFEGGHTNESRTVYESGEVDEEMLHFPQGRVYELPHGLGARPVTVDIFASFRETLGGKGDRSDDTQPNNVAATAGNQAVIESWDETLIRIRNDTCAEFYIRVVAIADPDDVGQEDADLGLGGMGGLTSE